MCVKDQIIKAKKDAVREAGESRVFECQNFKEKKYVGKLLAIRSSFPGTTDEGVRKPDGSLQASTVMILFQFITI